MLVLIMATIINTVLMTLQALFEFLTEDCHLLAASMLQVPRPMDVPFNPSTSCQGATHVFVVFLLHHGLTVGVPAVVGRLGLVLDTGLGFWASRTDETGLPPLNPPGSSNRKPQRNSDFDFRFFAVSKNAESVRINSWRII
jgi:hypothetical protein